MAPTSAEKKSFVFFLLSLFLFAAYLLYPYAMPILLATILVILSYPIYEFFFKKFKERRYLSATVSTLVVFVFILVPFILVGSLITTQIFSWVDSLSRYLEGETLSNILAAWNISLTSYIEAFNSRFHMNLDFARIAQTALKQFLNFAYTYSPGVLSGTFNFVVSFFIMMAVLFFFFADGKRLFKELVILSPLQNRYEDILAREIKNTIYGVFYGSFFTALIQALLGTLAYFIVKVDGFLVWGFITFLTSFIPFVGAAGIWFPIALILILLGDYKSGIFLLIYGVVIISSVDNFLKPYLIKGKSDIHPLLLFLSILGGLRLFGPAGLLFGPIIMAVFLAALKIYKQDFIQVEERPSDL